MIFWLKLKFFFIPPFFYIGAYFLPFFTSLGVFSVFANVIGEGMEIVDAIDNQLTINLGFKASEAPYVTSAYQDPTNFLYMNVEIVERLSSAPNLFETNSGLFITSVDIDNGSDLIALNFNVY